MPSSRPGDRHDAADLRMAVPAGAAWCAAAVAVAVPASAALVAGLVLALGGLLAARRRALLAALTLILVGGVCVLTAARTGSAGSGPVADLAGQHAVAHLRLSVTSDPRVVDTPHRQLVVFDADVERVRARGVRTDVGAQVVAWAPGSARDLRIGATVVVVGRLGPPDDSRTAASVHVQRIEAVDRDRAWWWAASDRMRAAVSESVSGRDPDVRALVPALVHGDDHGLSDELAEDFRDTGLTHLLAVSGTNLTLVVGFLLSLARPLGVRGRGQIVLGLLGTAAFVVLARPEPSVVRAAAMGLVALLGLGAGGRGRGVRCLAWAVIGLVLVNPWLSRSPGFVLSVLATGGILVLGPPWRAALARWMPRWSAEALSVPLAAQLACMPVIAALSGKVSLVAVAANLLAGPAVGPATVLGLLGGLVGLGSASASHLVGIGSGLCAHWIVAVGRRGAALPGAAYDWGGDAFAVSVLAVFCLGAAVAGSRVLRRPVPCLAVVLVTGAAVVHPVSPGWPPGGWVMVACNVGQGDATVLNAGGGRAVVVDTGPDPRAVDRCLGDLGVDEVPVVVLTHGHADHVDGLPGVLDGRDVGEIVMGPSGGPSPPGVPTRPAEYGATRRVGQLTWTVLGPDPRTTGTATGSAARGGAGAGEGDAAPAEEGTDVNNLSVVLLVEVQGVRLLLTGDIEPEAQAALLRARPDLRADVLKVPHHGSARQDPELFETLDARFGTVSAGVGNSYGHPAARTLDLLRRTGTTPLRTDRQGDLGLIADDGTVRAVTR